MKRFLVVLLLVIFNGNCANAQENVANFEDLDYLLWMGSYNQFRLSDKFFWRAEFHYRRTGTDEVPVAGRMAQIYNRHAIMYLPSPNFNASFGVVLRLDFTNRPADDMFERVVPEPRFWQEFMWVIPNPRFQIFHRVRTEQRWSRNNNVDSDWIFRYRWRYKFFMKIPLNSQRLGPGVIFANPDVEIIMQSGRTVGASSFEDLRLYPSLGYIHSARVTYTAGIMYTTGQRLSDPFSYRQRWVIRLNAYVNLDFRREQKKLPSIRFSD